MSELKYCPFCGSTDVYSGSHRERVNLWDDGPIVYQCGCGTCDASGAEYPTKQEAEEAWNRRYNG